MNLIRNKTYLVRLRDGRRFTGTYLGLDYAARLMFDLRPDAGTQYIPDRDIRAYEEKAGAQHSIGTLASA